MIENFLHLLLAVLGLSFLIFIHELGHYIVGRWVGMTIEVFSIGFGKPLFSWTFQGVRWQIGSLPFGGYVRFAGMEKKGSLEPHQVPDGFFGKSPAKRIAVALAGPFANILFTLVAFTCIWLAGGQEKLFMSSTNVIGSLDPQSKLYSMGVRPGDRFTGIDGQPVHGFQDLAMSLLLDGGARQIEGQEIDYQSGKKEPFAYAVEPGLKPLETIRSLGVEPAQYLIFNQFISPESPMRGTGIQKGDRIVWVNGELTFSNDQLSRILNASKALLTVQRDGKTFLARVPLIKIGDLQLTSSQKDELDDWRHEASLNLKTPQLAFIPYNLTNDSTVEGPIPYLDQNAEQQTPTATFRDPVTAPLRRGDRIIAAYGFPIASSYELLSKLQTPYALVMVQRSKVEAAPSVWSEADRSFESSIPGDQIAALARSIGTAAPAPTQRGELILFAPVPLKSVADLPLDPKTEAQSIQARAAMKAAIEKIDNTQEREMNLKKLEELQKRLVLGVAMTDRPVLYNPPPFEQFFGVFKQTAKTIVSLFSGNTSPKHMSGPIGIVQALQFSWKDGIKDALFWLGFVSLNLAVLNLLPIPILDGGHVLFSLIESVTKKPIKAKTMEKLVIPFVVLLVLFFIYVTYQDIVRIFTGKGP